jgi:hypothetical protein
MKVTLLQRLARFFSPLWLMQDVSSGSFEERAAAYRHNRRMRGELFTCMKRWALSGAVAIVLSAYFDALGEGRLSIFALLAAACGTFIACAVCALFVMGYAYLYLAHHEW